MAVVQSCGRDRAGLGEVRVASDWCAWRQWTPADGGAAEQGSTAGSGSDGAQGSCSTGVRLTGGARLMVAQG